ncbi:ABC transporter substrate-binding protein [Kushneria sp. AK178]
MNKQWLAGLALGLFSLSAQADITVHDIEGRDVTLDQPAEHIVLAEGRQLIALSLLDKDPAHWLLGWGSDMKRSPELYDIYHQRAPELDDLPIVGDGPGPGSISVERIIALNPDAVVLSRSQVPVSQGEELMHQLEAAGIPVVFIDFATDPLDDTVPSLRALGTLLGREDQAERFISFYEQKRQAVLDRIEADSNTDRPSVMIEAHAGMNECCNSPGQGSFDHFAQRLNVDNIGAEVLKGKSGRIDPQYVLTRDPDVYIATGGGYLRRVNGLVLGPDVDEAEARQSLKHILQRPLIGHLSAVENERVHGLYHHLINTPLNILVLEQMAQWSYPDRFQDIDASRTLEAINEHYISDSFNGTLWVDLKG